MGLFPNLFKGSPAHIISNVVFPGLTLGIQSLKAAVPVVKQLATQLKPSAPAVHNAPTFKAMYGPQPFLERQPTYAQQPYTPVTNYGGGGFAPSYDFPPPQQPFEGGSPWDYSTRYPVSFQTPSATYSEPRDRTWEDLSSLLPIVTPFL